MSVSKVIDFLPRELARHGSDLMSGADFSSIGIIESELDNANVTDFAGGSLDRGRGSCS